MAGVLCFALEVFGFALSRFGGIEIRSPEIKTFVATATRTFEFVRAAFRKSGDIIAFLFRRSPLSLFGRKSFVGIVILPARAIVPPSWQQPHFERFGGFPGSFRGFSVAIAVTWHKRRFDIPRSYRSFIRRD
jgi:hypothetical protein